MSASRATPRWMLVMTLVASVTCVAGLASIAGAYFLRQGARARWQEVAGHVGEAGYSPSESDARYLEVEAWGDWMDVGLRTLATGLAGLVFVAIARRRQGSGAGGG